MRRRALTAIGLALSLVALATLTGACGRARQDEGVTPTSLGCRPGADTTIAGVPTGGGRGDAGRDAGTGTTIAGVPTPYTCVDTGFRPDPDGFSFANWGGVAAGDAITTKTLVALFGAENVCIDAGQRQCTPRPSAIAWAAQMNELLANGRCEGMSVAAERFFTGLTELARLDGSAHATEDLSEHNRLLVEDITYWWATQLMPEVAAAASASRSLQPSAIVAAVTAGLRGGSANTMGLYSKRGGHAVTPFAVTYDEPYFSIWVYDSNHPGQPGRVLVDAAAETWHYQSRPSPDALADEGWNGSGPGGLEYTPMSVRMLHFTTPFSNDTGENAFALAIVATSADSSTAVDLHISGPGIDIDTADDGPAPKGLIVHRIENNDGIGHATFVYVRPSIPLVITPTASETRVPVKISIDGPNLPWQEVTLTTPAFPTRLVAAAPGALPLRIEVSPNTGTRVIVTGHTTVTVSYNATRARVHRTKIAGPGETRVPARDPTGAGG